MYRFSHKDDVINKSKHTQARAYLVAVLSVARPSPRAVGSFEIVEPELQTAQGDVPPLVSGRMVEEQRPVNVTDKHLYNHK
jgi:hypothetical protein